MRNRQKKESSQPNTASQPDTTRQTDGKPAKHSQRDWWSASQPASQPARQMDRQTARWTARQTDRQTARQTYRQRSLISPNNRKYIIDRLSYLALYFKLFISVLLVANY